MAYIPVTHVLFDMDGLLLNTEELYTEAFQAIIGRYGKEYTYDFKKTLMGLHSDEGADRIINVLNLPMTRDDFLKEAKKQYAQLFPHCKIMPGARELIEHLHKNKIPIGLATSSTKESYDLKTQHHQDLFSLFPHKTLGSSDAEVKKGKPHPDIFIVASSKFPDKPLPKKVLVFEDAVNGVEAALAAGMQVVMVPDPQLPREDTKRATLVIESLQHFKPELFGLPPFENVCNEKSCS